MTKAPGTSPPLNFVIFALAKEVFVSARVNMSPKQGEVLRFRATLVPQGPAACALIIGAIVGLSDCVHTRKRQIPLNILKLTFCNEFLPLKKTCRLILMDIHVL